MMYKHIYFVIATSAPVSLYSHATSIIKFNGLNFSDWCEQIRFHLGALDLDLALLSEKPVAITSASSDEDRSFYKAWKRSNRLSLMFMQMTVANNIKSTIKNTEDAKEFMKSVEKCSQSESADKSLVGTLMSTLTNIKFDGSRTIHEHILEITNLAARLKTMGMEVNENFLVTFILNSLPSEYGPFHMNYNTLKDKWNVHELQSMLIQEEARLKKPIIHSTNLMGHKGARKKPGKKNGKGNHGQLKVKQSSAPIHKKGQIKDKCRFCNKPGHYQKDCLKRKAWFENKGKHNALGFLTARTTNPNERFIFMGNIVKVPVEAVGTYRLTLDTGHHLDLFDTFYVPSFSRNLISLSKLDTSGRKPSLRHLHDWGCQAEVRIYNPHEKKLNSRTTSGFFIGYPENQKEFDLSIDNDPVSFSQVIKEDNSTKWLDAMKEELKSMNDNEVWDLVELPKESKRVGCKWVFKTKRDSNGNIERYKARLVAKAHYDLELHQMDVKTAFLNGNLDEEVFMDQPEGFMVEGKEHMMETIPYASIVGSLLYAQTCTRPDISFAVGMLGRYQSNPGMDHWKAAKKVLRYLQGTKDYMLTYKRSDHLEVIGYSDSDFVGCVDTRKSTFGYLFLLAEGAISWKIAKQSIIAASTMEAEFVACFEATVHGLWLRNFISGLGIVDSAKHMELKYFAIKEEVQKESVSVEHISTKLMIADPLTKGLPPKMFNDHVERMGISRYHH
ncbi:Retrovirus-related Pol polyprotein from transposon TNT 1-94 [Cucumis melo var. makuwa]|uniref:Retrovirus-related Pol polyprotein from transposon TNT 1-94 n=1 Tax=Cucumis melo var. makuwa TaxID=1194695 RepID=A0A5A7TTF5_CUCMM|nr:Retrovirus-related Pol polyprotein from transposon TNT 1-94 [Cucumis melo var. makuwa]TYK04491.1 Retrovirus-related Pol polyprotein from transposon TNT 1-94 [Cucumis melo var. makuwa]